MNRVNKIGILTGLIFLIMFTTSVSALNFDFYQAPVEGGYSPWNHGTNLATRSTWLAAAGITVPECYENFESGWSNGQNIEGNVFCQGKTEATFDNVGGYYARTASGGSPLGGAPAIGSLSWSGQQNLNTVVNFGAGGGDYLGFYDFDLDHGNTVVTYYVKFTDGTTESIRGWRTWQSRYMFVGFVNRHPTAKFDKIWVYPYLASYFGIDELEWGTTTTTTTSTTSTTRDGPSEEIPEFPTTALPAIIAVGGYLAIRRLKK